MISRSAKLGLPGNVSVTWSPGWVPPRMSWHAIGCSGSRY